MTGWTATRFDELESIPLFAGLVWHPIRRPLGVRAFGVNAYTVEAAGQTVVEEHDEADGGHEELYIVISGSATFTIGEETLAAPAGTLIFISDPALRRLAVAEEARTLVLAIGGTPGEAFAVSAWEPRFAALPALRAGRFDEAAALIATALEEHPGHPAVLYDLACAESLAGRPQAALTHLLEAVRADPASAARAAADPDFDPIRREPGFPA
jgi:tetratricopeptide (TPR) repeat protein